MQSRVWRVGAGFFLSLLLLLSMSLSLALANASRSAGGDFVEEFDNITTLPADGWVQTNNSNPLGTTGWFQGNVAVFPAHSGSGYIGANFNNTTGGSGTISNWLITPELTLSDGDTVSFWTRVPTGSSWPDRLEVRMSLAGASTDVGTTATTVGVFTTTLLSVNPDLEVGGYPDSWSEYSLTLSGIGEPTNGRLAFRYYVTGAGPTGANSNYIGIDRFEYGNVSAEPSIVVEPTTLTSTQQADTVVTQTLTISNTGTTTLTWSIEEVEPALHAAAPEFGARGAKASSEVAGGCPTGDDISWLEVVPNSGDTAPGSASTVLVLFDSTGLAAGTYDGSLCVESNDAQNAVLFVEVTLEVTEAPTAVQVASLTASGSDGSWLFALLTGGLTLLAAGGYLLRRRHQV